MKNIAILSVPRSGSTWLGQIFNSSPEVLYRFQPNFAYSFPYALRKKSTEAEIIEFHKRLLATDDPFVTGRLSISGKDNLQFSKSAYNALVWKEVHHLHLAKTLMENSDAKVVGLVRSPLAVINSWIQIPREFDASWDVMEEWRRAEKKNMRRPENYFGYEKWKEVTLLFEALKEEYPDRFYLLRYDDLLVNIEQTMRSVFRFTGIEFLDQTRRFLRESRSSTVEDPYGIYKMRASDEKWKESLPEDIVNMIKDDVEGTGLQRYLSK